MHNKSSLELSDIQNKVIEELDVLTDAFASTFNELGKTVKAYSEEISTLVERFIKSKNGWRLYTSQCFDVSFIPFKSEYSIEKKFSIDFLDQGFFVAGQSILVKEVISDEKKKQVDVLSLSWGFRYGKDDKPTKYFYVEVEKEGNAEGAIFSKEEYETLEKKIKTSVGMEEDDFFELEHPDDGDSERFHVWMDFKYSKNVHNFFDICKTELIEKFIERIKD